MISPNYDKNYPPSLNCNYTFYGPTDQYINLVFKDFQLEETSRQCVYDNVTLFKYNEYHFSGNIWEKMGTYCRQDSPGHVRAKQKAVVLFQTDRWHEKRGFMFDVHLDRCGSDINSTTLIESPTQGQDGELLAGLNCIWKINAPTGQNIIVRFERVDLEHSDTCWFDYVSVYRNLNVSDENRAAKLCGNVSDISVDLVSDQGAIIFKTDASNNKGGFKAQVLIIPSCSRQIFLENSVYNLNIDEQTYRHNMDCHYLIKTDPGNIIEAKFNRFHITQCDAKNSSNSCSCHFLEIRDGGGPFAELIGKYCGHDLPTRFQSSTHRLWIRFATDSSTTTSSGFDIELKKQRSVCGNIFLNVTNTDPIVIQPPMSGDKYQKNMRCTWVVSGPEQSYNNLFEIIIERLDIQQGESERTCLHDYLQITDDTVKDFIPDKTFEDDIVFRGSSTQSTSASFYYGMMRPGAPHIFCGTFTENQGVSYYTGSMVHVKFVSDSEEEKGKATKHFESSALI